MEVKRISRSIAARWWVLVIAGVIGAVAAIVFVQQRNSEVEPVFRADAVVNVPIPEPVGRQAANTLPDELAVALDLAKTVNEAELNSGNRFITADAEDGSIVFAAIAGTEEEAVVVANEMRLAYVAADPNFDADAELESKLAEARLIRARLNDLKPPVVEPVQPTPEEEGAKQAQIDILQAQVDAIKAAVADLATSRLETNDSGEIADIDDALADYEVRLAELLAVLAPLQVVEPEPIPGEEEPDTQLSLADEWAVQALEARLTELETESAALIIAGVTGINVDLPDAVVTDESPGLVPTWLAMFVGFFAGAMFGSAILLIRDRLRGVVWHHTDVKSLVVLTEGPAEPLSASYISEIDRQRRKRSVQAVRSAIIGSSEMGQGTVVGFAAPSSTAAAVLEDLAYDVAASLSSVGRRVLVVDVGFTEKDDYDSASNGAARLRDLFDSVADEGEKIKRKAAAAISAADEQAPGLDVLIADPDVIDPADILVGRPIAELLEQGQESYDVVVVVQPRTAVRSVAGLSSYLQQQIIVCTRGRTTVSEIASEAIPRGERLVQLVGVAIVSPTSRRAPSRSESAEFLQAQWATPEAVVSRREKASAAANAGSSERLSAVADEPRPKPTPGRRRRSSSKEEPPEDRLRALDTYSVDESLFVSSSEPPSESS